MFSKKETALIDALAADIEGKQSQGSGPGKASKNKAKKKKKNRASARSALNSREAEKTNQVEEEEEEEDSDDEDPLERLVQQQRQRATPQLRHSGQAGRAGAPGAAAAAASATPSNRSNGFSGWVEAKVVVAPELEQELNAKPTPTDDEAALLRALRCFQLGDEIQAAKTEAAQANQSARRKGGGREGATGGPDAVQLLNLTLSCLDARSASDKAGASEGIPGCDLLSLLGGQTLCDGGQGEDVYFAPGLEPELELIPPGTLRPKDRSEHALILRVARKAAVAEADFALAQANAQFSGPPPGSGSGPGPLEGEGGGHDPQRQGKLGLETALLERKGFDRKFHFLKPFHPLHAYYQCLCALGPGHLANLVSRDEEVETATKAFLLRVVSGRASGDAKASPGAGGGEQGAETTLGKELKALGEEERAQVLGQALYPLVGAWFGSEVAPKVTGMLIEIEIERILPLLAKLEELRLMAGKAVAALRAHGARHAPNGNGH